MSVTDHVTIRSRACSYVCALVNTSRTFQSVEPQVRSLPHALRATPNPPPVAAPRGSWQCRIGPIGAGVPADVMRPLPGVSLSRVQVAGGNAPAVRVANLARVANEATRDDWASGAAGWVRNERLFDGVFSPFTAALLGAADLGSARRVLDVGCGSGTLLVAAVAAGADAVGVDVSPSMVEAARRRAPVATVVTADAQTADLLTVAPGAPFDRVVSRFGVMFFAEPEAAFANIRSATVHGARLAFVCWRESETDMFSISLRALTARLADPPARSMPGSPGPMSLANADRIRDVLTVAGWSDVTIEPSDGPCDYAIDGSDGVEECLTIALSATFGRAVRAKLEPGLSPAGWQAVLDQARAELRAQLVGGAVRFVGHTWPVAATNR